MTIPHPLLGLSPPLVSFRLFGRMRDFRPPPDARAVVAPTVSPLHRNESDRPPVMAVVGGMQLGSIWTRGYSRRTGG